MGAQVALLMMTRPTTRLLCLNVHDFAALKADVAHDSRLNRVHSELSKG